MKKKPLILRCRLVRKGYCLNWFGVLLTQDTSWIDERIINHEMFHTRQMRELLYVPFYLLYVLEWFIRLIIYRNGDKAYRNISFEREAYGHGDEPDYRKVRRPYAWMKYLRRR